VVVVDEVVVVGLNVVVVVVVGPVVVVVVGGSVVVVVVVVVEVVVVSVLHGVWTNSQFSVPVNGGLPQGQLEGQGFVTSDHELPLVDQRQRQFFAQGATVVVVEVVEVVPQHARK
jgi:hypothetical protein